MCFRHFKKGRPIRRFEDIARFLLNAVAAGLCMTIGYVIIKAGEQTFLGWGLWLIGVLNLAIVVKQLRKKN